MYCTHLVYTARPAAVEALNAGRDVFERARRLLPSLPVGRSTPPPATLGDAQALVQQKQEAAQQQHKEPKQKQKGGKEAPATDQAFPGARIGGANDNSAYWTLVEVRMAHRRCSLVAKHCHQRPRHRLQLLFSTAACFGDGCA
jgi:hypothetical protein